MKDPGWITKAEAATVLGVDERTIERRARDGRIEAKAKPGFPTLYLAADVEILRQGTPQDVRTGRLEPGTAGNGNGNGRHTAELTKSSLLNNRGEDPIRQLAALVVQALTHAPTGPTGPTDAPTGPTLFLTIDEAAAVSGLSRACVRRLIDEQKLPALRDGRRWRIRRRDLEAL